MLLLKVEVEPETGIATKYFQFGCMHHRLAVAKLTSGRNSPRKSCLYNLPNKPASTIRITAFRYVARTVLHPFISTCLLDYQI